MLLVGKVKIDLEKSVFTCRLNAQQKQITIALHFVRMFLVRKVKIDLEKFVFTCRLNAQQKQITLALHFVRMLLVGKVKITLEKSLIPAFVVYVCLHQRTHAHKCIYIYEFTSWETYASWNLNKLRYTTFFRRHNSYMMVLTFFTVKREKLLVL